MDYNDNFDDDYNQGLVDDPQRMPRLNRENFRSEEDWQRAQAEYRRMQRQAEQATRERIWYFDIMLSSIYIFILTIGLVLGRLEDNCHNFKTWI